MVEEARDSHQLFQRMIVWRDVREVGVELIMIPVFLYFASRPGALWTSYLPVGALVFVAGFMVIDRLLRRRTAPPPGSTVAESLAGAVRDVEHQIWLLRNVMWWYIGPLMGSLLADSIYERILGKTDTITFVIVLAVIFFVGRWVWKINQQAVQRSLEPRRAELQAVLDQMRDEG
jgi:hypothetical protein